MALDSDAFENSLRFAETLMNEGIEVFVIELEDSDPSELGFESFYKLLKNTEPLTLRKLMEYKLVGL